MVNNGILIKIFMEINADNLSDIECLLSFIDDFPCWSQEPKTEIFIPRKEQTDARRRSAPALCAQAPHGSQ